MLVAFRICLVAIFLLVTCHSFDFLSKRNGLKRPLHVIKDYIYNVEKRIKRSNGVHVVVGVASKRTRRSMGEDSEEAAKIRGMIFRGMLSDNHETNMRSKVFRNKDTKNL